MRTALRRVVAGLGAVSAGIAVLMWTPLTVVLYVCAACGSGEHVWRFILIAHVATGGVIGLVGRWRCLAVPTEAGPARGRIVLSTALHGVGVVSGTVHALALPLIPKLPESVILAAVGFSAFAVFAGGVFFHLFTWSIAEFAGEWLSVEVAKSHVAFSGMVLVAIVIAVATVATDMIGVSSGGAGLAILTGLAALILIGQSAMAFLTRRLLAQLSLSMSRMADAELPDDETD